MMNGSRFSRGGKGKTLLYAGVVLFLLLLVYVFREAHVQLNDARSSADKCFQQQESLSAQFQVILEYKTRLEKSLQSEKSLSVKTREELQKSINEEKDVRAKEKSEALNKYDSLQQQYKMLQSQREDLQQEFDKLSEAHLKIVEEKSHLDVQLQALQEQHRGLRQEMSTCKTQLLQFESDKAQQFQRFSQLQNEFQQASETTKYFQNENIQLQQHATQIQRELRDCQLKLTAQKAETVGSIAEPQIQKQHPAVEPSPKTSSTEGIPQQQAPHEQPASSSTNPSPHGQQGNALQHQLVAPLQMAPAQSLANQEKVLEQPHKLDDQESRAHAVLAAPAQLKKHTSVLIAKPQQYSKYHPPNPNNHHQQQQQLSQINDIMSQLNRQKGNMAQFGSQNNYYREQQQLQHPPSWSMRGNGWDIGAHGAMDTYQEQQQQVAPPGGYLHQEVHPVHQQNPQLARPYQQQQHDFNSYANAARGAGGGANYFVPVDINHHGFQQSLSKRDSRFGDRRVQRREAEIPNPQQKLWLPVRNVLPQKESQEIKLSNNLDQQGNYAYDAKKNMQEEDDDKEDNLRDGKEEEIPRVPQEGIPLDGDEDEDDLDQLDYEVKGGDENIKGEQGHHAVKHYQDKMVNAAHLVNEKMQA